MAKDYDFDIAISFLTQDEALALELRDRLSPNTDVFVYSKKQEDLAGTDGLESFRAAFGSRARLVVVLYRSGWGQTPWTRVEETAIKERVLSDGWECLFFMMLGKGATPPKWLPKTHIRFNFEEYGLEQALGAIKGCLQRLGGILRPSDPVQQAKVVERRKAFHAERQRLLRCEEGVKAVREEVSVIYQHAESCITKINASTELKLRIGNNGNLCVMTNGQVAVTMYWCPYYANTLEGSPLVVRELAGPVCLPGENSVYAVDPRVISEKRYEPELSEEAGWCWVTEAKPKEFLSSTKVADMCVEAFLQLIDRVASGDLRLPSILDELDSGEDPRVWR